MDESKKSRRVETREFWEAAVRLWAESGLPVREFCSREGLTEHTFYSWRRELLPGSRACEVNQESSVIEDETPTNGRRRRGRQSAGVATGKKTPAVEFLPVRVVGGLHVHATAPETSTGTSPIEIVGASPWRVRILGSFNPATLDAVLTTLERRPC